MTAERHDDPEIATLVEAVRRGDADPAALYGRLYHDLHALAHAQRCRWHGHWTMNTTALVHEAYEKLAGKDDFESRAHVLATASRAMRQVLVSYAERRHALKRGGATPDLALDDERVALLTDDQADDVLALDDALARLARVDARDAQVVECRFFGGLSAQETAAALDISESTVTRSWRAARAWLRAELADDVLDVDV